VCSRAGSARRAAPSQTGFIQDGKPRHYQAGEWIEDPDRRPKSKNVYGSQGNWPLGILEAEAYPAIGLVEGAPG
jgi:hypothetical protein